MRREERKKGSFVGRETLARHVYAWGIGHASELKDILVGDSTG